MGHCNRESGFYLVFYLLFGLWVIFLHVKCIISLNLLLDVVKMLICWYFVYRLARSSKNTGCKTPVDDSHQVPLNNQLLSTGHLAHS